MTAEHNIGAPEHAAQQAQTHPPTLDEIQKLLETLLREFQSKLKIDAKRDEIIDRQHEELQAFRNGTADKAVLPLVLDVIRVYDDLNQLLKGFARKSAAELAVAELLKAFSAFASDLEEMLFRHGIESFVEEAEVFNPKRQRALKSVPVVEPGKERQISERLRKGFDKGGRVIRPEFVSVFVCQQPQTAKE